MKTEEKKLLDTIAQAIFDKKGFNILVLDVKGISTMTDYYIVAEGTVARHLKAIKQAISDKMKEESVSLYHTEGEDGEWIIMDYYDVVIHLLTPDMREKYALEDLWRKSKIVDVEIKLPKVLS